MFNDLHHLESRFAIGRRPAGGVAPSRYDVALDAYVEKQRRLEQASPLADAGTVRAFLAGIAGLWTALTASKRAPKSGHTVVSR